MNAKFAARLIPTDVLLLGDVSFEIVSLISPASQDKITIVANPVKDRRIHGGTLRLTVSGDTPLMVADR